MSPLTITPIQESITSYLAKGWGLCRIPEGAKLPAGASWQLNPTPNPEAFQSGDGVGLLCGPLSGNIVCADLDFHNDDAEAWNAADELLPFTQLMDGRGENLTAHRYFRLTDTEWPDSVLPGPGTQTRQAMDAGRLPRFGGIRHWRDGAGRCVDFIAAGGQVIIPPSPHKSGQPRQWYNGAPGEPTPIGYGELLAALQALAQRLGMGGKKELPPPPEASKIEHVPQTKRAERFKKYLDEAEPLHHGAGLGFHQQVFRMAAVACELGVDSTEAEALLLEWNNGSATPDSPREVADTIQRAYARCVFGAMLDESAGFRDEVDLSAFMGSLGEWLTDTTSPAAPEEKATEPTVDEREKPTDEPWPELQPFDTLKPPSLPMDALGPILGPLVAEIARAVEVPPELPLGMALAVASGACCHAFVVQASQGYSEPPVLWACAVEQSGARKSAVKSLVTSPAYAAERELNEEWQAALASREAQADVLRGKAKAKKKEGEQAEDDERAMALAAEAAELEERASNLVPPAPRLVVEDVTPEHLGTMLDRQEGERLILLSDEGGLFDNLGRYSKPGQAANLDLFLQCHAVQSCRVDRGSRPPVMLHEPKLAIAVMPQPSVVESLRAKDGMRGRGLFARFIWLLPQSKIGFRSFEQPPVSEAVLADWAHAIRRLLSFPVPHPQQGPAAIRLSDEARQRWKAFVKANELRLRPGADLHHMCDWGSKASGLVLRLAGVLHCLEQAEPSRELLSRDTMGRAVALVQCFAEHAKAAFGLMKADETEAAAKRILEILPRVGEGQPVPLHALGQACHNSMDAKAANEALQVLVKRGYVRLEQRKPERGRPATWVHIRPELMKGGVL